MAGVPDIPILSQVVNKTSDAAADAFFRGLRYLFCYKELDKDLDTEIKKVNIQEDLVNQRSVQEEANGNTIKPHVSTWRKDVKEIQQSAEDFSKKYRERASWKCLKCLPIPKPFSRFRLGREAARTTKLATDLINSGEKLLANDIADPPTTENLPNPAVAFQEFQSRKDVYDQLWKALVTEGSSLILGIYGMPGVGKTRTMEQLWQEAMEKKKFDMVVRANVGSEELNVIKLQDQIAGYLDCKFGPHDNANTRAARLKNSLMKAGNVLVIFDDVWTQIPIDDIIGTSFGESSSSKGSKILLTSRTEVVCLRNKCERPVQITILKVEEAWDLFQNTVGTFHINSLADDTLARKICNKCAGLPLLIRAVGKALEFMSPHMWEDALYKLENGDLKKIPDMDPEVYACVKLSIDRLQDDGKSCLFLCSLFPEDADIDIKKLIQFAVGSQLIPSGESTIRSMVEYLTKYSLLLECNRNHITKLHDIIRSVARSVASEDSKYAFLHEKCVSQLPDNAGYSTSKLLRLDVEGDDVLFLKDLVCTDLYTLWLQCNNHPQQFSGDFFSMFVNLGFLMLQNVHFRSVQFSLQPLGKLKMLIFDNCDIRETDNSLFPINLRTLCIWSCNLPSPLDLPDLTYLQKLDIQEKYHNEVIMVPNAISSLSSLEELHIPNGFNFPADGTGITPALDEISKLSRLTSLKIFFSDFEACQGKSIYFKLLKYDISVGYRRNTQALPVSTRLIELIGVEVKRDEALQGLIERAEEVRLNSTVVDVCDIWNSNRDAFTDLRELDISYCDTIEYIARISQDKIQHSGRPLTSFSKLTILRVRSCSAMKYLFCKPVAKCLVQLQELYVSDCDAMEVIVMNEGPSDGEVIKFSKLKTLQLTELESLKSFYGERKEMHSGSMDNSVISCAQYKPLFDGMVAFPSLEKLDITSLEVIDIWEKHYSSSFCNLKTLILYRCNKLESVIPQAMLHKLGDLEFLFIRGCSRLRNLIHLEDIRILQCGMMREIIGGGEQKEEEITHDLDIIVFPELKSLTLEDLKSLTSFWGYQGGESANYKVQLPSMVEFFMKNCGEINLERIELGRDNSTCPLERLIIYSDYQMQLPCNWPLHLYNLEYLSLDGCWWHDLKSLRFPKLKTLWVNRCGCSALFTISGFGSLQQLQRLEISDCDILKEIVEDVRGDEHAGIDSNTIKLLQLDSVVLREMPNLKSFIHGANYECYMPALKKVVVNNCGLWSLSTCSVFRNFQQLNELVVSNCRFLEDIVEDGRRDESSDTNDKIITVSQLSSVSLRDLPNLTSFSRSVTYAFNMPKLRVFYLFGCPQLENFTYLKTSTGLVYVYTEGHQGEKVTDLNDFMIENHKRVRVKVLVEMESGIEIAEEEQPQDVERESEIEIVEEEQPREG